MKRPTGMRLAQAFIGVALVNFLVGAVLGAVLASALRLGPELMAIHGELNPYGWLSMLIYGMTYAVLGMFTQLRLPSSIQGIVHLYFKA
ncbi:hypothetical protein [Alicyclobacillus acidoterrestris]|uniref:Uncharacterized protein n=1 Tax=Alicyclobacillus acidoterrestris (strain ATCC 49025 / DSM 3922 / CIP 106132 / NCIMB 13137 / GD3B) TaxID=1356854 RepID=T0DNW4_ALIAG|nr:hypothetical protein [Alicyclobacillus acidoterrestris]EPZ53037.1 hypothetical protein N007_18370 [Alicyclobacillus acidoterrestris ATCC 49025]UNO47202.1 hypothetical protein K1I37_10630 [Alicyclobacillus acidoterrestris]